MPGGAGSGLIDCPAHRSPPGRIPDQEAPGSIALLYICTARDDTSVPTVSARALPTGQVATHPTPDAIRHEQPLQQNNRGGALGPTPGAPCRMVIDSAASVSERCLARRYPSPSNTSLHGLPHDKSRRRAW